MERGPNIGTFSGRGAPDERTELIMLAEGTTPAAEGFAAHVVSAAGHLWHELDLSLTGALRQVIDEVDRNVYDWNEKSIAQHRVALGVTCFARRGEHAVLAQAGPAVAFHASASGTRVLAPEPAHARPIGSHDEGVAATLARANLAAGDRLLLLSTAALTILDDDLIADILRLPTEQILPELYQRLRELRHVSVVLLTAPEGLAGLPLDHEEGEAADEPAPDHGEPEIGGQVALADQQLHRMPVGLFQPSLFLDGGDEENRLAEARDRIRHLNLASRRVSAPPREEPLHLAPLQKAVGDDILGRIASEHSATAAVSRSRAEVAREAARTANHAHDRWRNLPPPAEGPEPSVRTPSGEGVRPAVEDSPPLPPPAMSDSDAPPPNGRIVTRNQSFSRGIAQGGRSTRPPAPVMSEAPLVSDLADGRRAEAARTQAAGTLTDMIASDSRHTAENAGPLVRPRANMGGRWKSGGGRRQVGGAHGPPTWLIIVVGLGVLLAVLGALVVPGMFGEQEGAREARLIGAAQELLAQADVQQDPAARRQSLSEAHGLLLDARSLNPSDATTLNLIDEVVSSLEAMNAIVVPASVERIASLAQVGDSPLAVTKLAVSDTEAYVLDAVAGQVIVTDFASGHTQVVYDAADHPAPVAIVYSEIVDLGSGRLLIADAEGGLWTYRPLGTLTPIPFAAPGGMNITDMAVYDNRLYVLDAAHGVVLEFPASDGGFSAEPSVVLDSNELTGARYLMVDGEIITVDIDGTVHRFSGEISLVMNQSGIDRPLTSAKSANAFTSGGEIAIADPAGDRVVILNRDGTFARQYRHDDFQRVTALAMRDGAGYVISGSELRRVIW